MKSFVLASGLLIILTGQAHAGCSEMLLNLASAVTAAEIAPEPKAQLQDMQQQADKLCSAGHDAEAADVIAEAFALLAAEAK